MLASNRFPHCPILLKECLDIFSQNELKVFVDGTLGAGGHAEAILQAHPEIECFIGIDKDPIALEIASNRLKVFGDRVKCIQGNYSEIKKFVPSLVDGIFLDLGVSSMQLDTAERGMSFSKEGPLDMRMDSREELTAEWIINHWTEEQLGQIFKDYGEEPRWRFAAKRIVEARKNFSIKTTLDLVKILRPVLFNKKSRKQINPMTLIFQALRIAVNQELKALEEGLPLCIEMLAPKGRLGVISFHSLEDRIVKNTFREFSGYRGGDFPKDRAPIVNILTKKPIVPTEEEQLTNPRSRSAKMRAVVKL